MEEVRVDAVTGVDEWRASDPAQGLQARPQLVDGLAHLGHRGARRQADVQAPVAHTEGQSAGARVGAQDDAAQLGVVECG